MATEKLLEEMTIKLTAGTKRKLAGLAEADAISASELVRNLIDFHIDEREKHFRRLASIFGQNGSAGKE